MLTVINVNNWVEEKQAILAQLKGTIPAHADLLNHVAKRINMIAIDEVEELAYLNTKGDDKGVSVAIQNILSKLHHYYSPMISTLRELVRSRPLVTEQQHIKESERLPLSAKPELNIAFHKNLGWWGRNVWMTAVTKHINVARTYYPTYEHSLYGKWWDKIGDDLGGCVARGPYTTTITLARDGVEFEDPSTPIKQVSGYAG